MQMITGNKKGGGKKPRAPHESPDSIRSMATAKILVAIGEGELAGELTGKEIYLDGTPLISADGTKNFPGVRWEYRSGNQFQDYIQGIPGVENDISVGVELRHDKPWVKAITNTELSAVRVRFGFPALQRQHDNGDVGGYRIEYAIDLSIDGGSFKEVLKAAVDGKTTTLYERSHRIDLPAAQTGWQIRVRRNTQNSTSGRIADTMNVQAMVEVIDVKLRYPNTALLFVEFDAKQFSSIPQISCEPQGKIIRIPSTYDPVNRTYSGVWDGTFKLAASNNPAWVFYDLLLAERYGCGRRLTPPQIDKWELYRIAQYCDQPIPDGRGGDGMEPRFMCDVYIQSQEEAWTVIHDLAAIFRGMIHSTNNMITARADMPGDIDYLYTRANVMDGKFNYSGTSERNRYSSALVSYSDPDNAYQDAVEAVMDLDLVRRYGVNQLELTAIGCTRQTEAQRRGKWALLTNDRDRIVSFAVGLDGQIPLVGNIIGVADEMLSGRALGGRISSVDGRKITLDRKADAKPGDRLIANLPSGKSQGRTIQSVSGKIITINTAYSEPVQPQAVWSVDADDLAIQQYRVSSIADNGDGSYSITALQHDPSKYAAIDKGARLDERPISVIPPGVQAPPENIRLESQSIIDQGIAINTLRVEWDNVANAIAYEAEWRRNSNNWVSMSRLSTAGFEVPNIYAGRYLVRVRAINAIDISSVWTNSAEVELNGKVGDPPAIKLYTSGLLFGIHLSWIYPKGTEDTLKTEIWHSSNNQGDDEQLLSDIPYPKADHQMPGLSAGREFWFKARLVDKSGNQGPWTEWTRGQASSDASDILDYIKDDVVSTVLGQQMLTDISEMQGNVLSLSESLDDVASTVKVNAETIADLDGKLSANYNIKVAVDKDGKQYAAGMGIGVENTPNGMQSQVLFMADRFAFLNLNDGKTTTPFAIENGQTIINSAMIKDGTIDNAKIGNTIQSNNYVEGASGWKFDKNGRAELSDAVFRGDIYAENGYFRGTVYAEKIRGDVAVSIVLNKNVDVHIAPENFDRRLVIPPFFVSAQGGDHSSLVRTNCLIFINGITHTHIQAATSMRRTAIRQAGFEYRLPANTSITIKFTADGEGSAPPLLILFATKI